MQSERPKGRKKNKANAKMLDLRPPAKKFSDSEQHQTRLSLHTSWGAWLLKGSLLRGDSSGALSPLYLLQQHLARCAKMSQHSYITAGPSCNK